jgi:hypothetical protein
MDRGMIWKMKIEDIQNGVVRTRAVDSVSEGILVGVGVGKKIPTPTSD